MHACTVTTRSGSSDFTAVVVGHCDAELPAPVERAAAVLAKGKGEARQRWVDADDQRYLVIKPQDADYLIGGEVWRALGAELVAAARQEGAKALTLMLGGSMIEVQAVAEGAVLGDYRFDDCRSGKAAKRKTVTLRIPGGGRDVALGVGLADAQNAARTLGDLPPNQLYPAAFAKCVRKLATGTGLKVSVIEGVAALEKARFPGLVQVGRGSARPPALVTISYAPGRPKAKAPRLALVGKGITFDSGGISLKPGAGMWEMKMDMGGAAAVVGAMLMIAQLGPKVPVTAYLALAENMPDGSALRPGDIYRARNGTWVHVDNTDAEGRLVMSDVLTYACEEGASHLVDAATLTGAALVGLGTSVAAVMSPDEDWAAAVRRAGQARGEEFWPLPCYGEYRKQLDHPHADINNVGGRTAGTITAGLFLKEFVSEEVAWAHCDIAGPAMRTDGWRYYAKGATAFGARSFAELAASLG